IQGPSGTVYNLVADVPVKPVLIQANGQTINQGFDWTFDATFSAVRIGFAMPTSGENLTLFFQNSAIIPSLSFLDQTVSPVNSVNFRILDSQGNIIPYTPGAALPQGNHYLEVYYAGSRIYRNNIASIGSPQITLEMLALDNSSHYIALNSTATSII